MTTFTANYLMWHHFGRREDECDQDVINQYRSYFLNHPNPFNLAMFMEAYLKYANLITEYRKVSQKSYVWKRASFFD
jgi:hypothetical protein